jgi:branched-chain amino acid transport system ATP-binding protein
VAERLLQARGVNKRFGGLQALADVGIAIERGQVYGLMVRTAPARPPSSTC